MSITVVPSLLEQSVKTKNAGLSPQVLSNLGGTSISDTASISGTMLTHTSQIASISATNNVQAIQIASISAGLATAGIPRAEVANVSANIIQDINNLDLSLTALIDQQTIQTNRITGSGTTIVGYLTVSISGATYKLGLIA